MQTRDNNTYPSDGEKVALAFVLLIGAVLIFCMAGALLTRGFLPMPQPVRVVVEPTVLTFVAMEDGCQVFLYYDSDRRQNKVKKCSDHTELWRNVRQGKSWGWVQYAYVKESGQ